MSFIKITCKNLIKNLPNLNYQQVPQEQEPTSKKGTFLSAGVSGTIK